MTAPLFDEGKPTGSSGSANAVPTDANANDISLRDMVGIAQMRGFGYSTSGGTYAQPTYILLSKNPIVLRGTCTWTSGKLTQIKWERSVNNGADYTTGTGAGPILAADQVLSYDANGDLQTATNAGGIGALIWVALGKAAKVISDLATHAALTVASGAHSAGSMASQNSTAVAITGGNVAVTEAKYGRSRAAVVAWGDFSGAKAIDWSAGEVFTGRVIGAVTFSDSNLPSSGFAGSVTLKLQNPGAYSITWPAAWDWPAGTAPTRTSSGYDLYEAFCDGGAIVNAAQAQRDSR